LSFVALFLFLFLSPAWLYAQPEEGEGVLERLSVIEARLQKIEAGQQEVLSREEKILAELDRVRIWCHKR